MSGRDKNGPSRSAVLGIRFTAPIFNAPIDSLHRFIAPRHIARFRCKEIPIGLVPTHPVHRIDAGAASQHLAHVHWYGSPVKLGIGLGLKVPVALASQIGLPLCGLHNAWGVVVAACLEQQHGNVRILGKSTRDHRARRTGTANDKVITGLQFGTELFLICMYA